MGNKHGGRHALVIACGVALAASSARAADPAPVDFDWLKSPIIYRGDALTAYRDPAAVYDQGQFHLYFTVCRMEKEGAFWYLGYSRSSDLKQWSEPELLTPRDRNLNFSSPGNVIRYGGQWVICVQTYPTPNNEAFGTADSRIWTMRSRDLRRWSEPELLRVKGPDVPREKMGRMIDPYLIENADEPGKWWCFYKQNGVSMSWSRDLKTWTYVGRRSAGENVTILRQGDRYAMFHSPGNGIGLKFSRNLAEWGEDSHLLTLGQKDWPWAQGRLTAATVIDLTREPRVGRYLMFFHGSSREGMKTHRAHGHASLAMAWSDDLVHWTWPGKK